MHQSTIDFRDRRLSDKGAIDPVTTRPELLWEEVVLRSV